MVFQFGGEVRIPDVARNLELLMASGNAYSSFTVGGNTRKYHGLFIRNGRLLLAGFDEMVNGIRFSSQHYAGSSNTHGLSYLHAFSAYPPSWIYMIDDIIIQKTIMFDGELSIIYNISGDADLWIRPLIADRSVHDVLRDPHPIYQQERDGIRWGGLYLEGDLSYDPNPDTYWNVWYQREHERGYEAVEDLHSPGVFLGRVEDSAVIFRCRGDTPVVQNTSRGQLPQTSIEWLEWASSSFCHGDEIVAGYHWFCESWGRDSAISVTGLLIERGLKREACRVLRRLSDMIKGGVLANRFPDNYHSSDSSLWFIHALFSYRRRWGDDHFMETMKPVIKSILEEYPLSDVASLDHNLIAVVPKSTWMDTEFTPRKGKPVEINALWVHALSEAEAMGIETPVSPESAVEAFQQFWNPERSCLYDLIDPVDPAIRPNQVIALSLGLIPQQQATSTLNTITALLLTPYGLRTLSSSDQDYQGRYTGDRSYHNGCVWPWLTAYYVEALLRNGMARERIGPILVPILHHLRDAGVGYMSEIFDGDWPHRPGGCIAQAWSVAEIARAYRLIHKQS